MGVSAGALLSLLLAVLLTVPPGALGASPGLVARITDKGLEYAAKEGLQALQSKLHGLKLLQIHHCELRASSLKPLPSQGLAFSVSNSDIMVQGRWKARKSFVRLQGFFDLQVRGIAISFDLLLGSDSSGRPTVSASRCHSHIGDVDVDVSGDASWLLNLFHNQIESKFQRELESKICELIYKSVTSDLQPYLQTLPVSTEIDSFISVDYSLMEAPKAATQTLDMMLKGEIFNHNHHSRVAVLPPVMNLPEEHNRMVYFIISNYVFNSASLIYQKAGYLNFSITDDLIPSDSNIRLNTKSFRSFAPRLARLYPNMYLELQGAVVSAPVLNFSPGNLSVTPEMEIAGFVLSRTGRVPVFVLGAATNISAMLIFSTNRITASLKPEKIHLELKESKVGIFNVELLEALLNDYILNNLYPKINELLEKGFPLPLLNHIQLYDIILQIHKDFLFLGANAQYMRV
ncbi:PREDICTED: lipopolysaccharide-binding protein [Condylura cristata]|uniref:lipopolysaccharide-binding protein n=1 Tax=Condylura cristata TaxID=143302 RepID=UPI0003343CC7|nr:PREDICTED: lipopolysaccharide-binding protein [Condylura cristata]